MLIAGLTAASTSETKYEILLTYPSDLAISDAAVVIPRTALQAIPQLEQGLHPVLTDKKGEYIPLQTDDLDGDGSWDESRNGADGWGGSVRGNFGSP
ncbi:MAG: DUF4861 family protein [Bacteroidales bacterium]